MFVGYAEMAHDAGNKKFTLFVAIFLQSAYILTLSSTMTVARVASSGGTFHKGDVPLDPPPNEQFLAAMGVLAILAYWFGMLGSISFLLFSLHKFQSGKPHERDGKYYKGRLLFYSVILFVAGFSQFSIGCYLQYTYPGDKFVGFFNIAMYIIRYPSIAIVVGGIQVCLTEKQS